MRFGKILGLLMVVLSTCSLGWAQLQPENSISHERDIAKSIQIYPNPAVEFVHIKLESATASKVTLTLHNIIGNQVDAETEIVDEHELRVRVKDLSSGYYLITIRDTESKTHGTYKFQKR
jgi:hypothetical protein